MKIEHIDANDFFSDKEKIGDIDTDILIVTAKIPKDKPWVPFDNFWSSFGNKTEWENWVDDSPTKQDMEQRDKEIFEAKSKVDALLKENNKKTAETYQHLKELKGAKENAEKTFKETNKNGGSPEKVAHNEAIYELFKLTEYSVEIELASQNAFKLHGEAEKMAYDAKSLRVGVHKSREMHKEAEKHRKEAEKADQAVTQMKDEYE